MRAEEFTQPHRMAKIEKTGRIVEILKHRDQVDFSDERGWYLINLEPGKRATPEIKWIPDTTRFAWVKEFSAKELDEGWRDVAAGVATAGALALGSPPADAKPAPGPSIQQQAAMTPIDKLRTAAKANGIRGTELAQFLAQCAHESANFKNMEEIGDANYFARKYDPKYAPKTAKILGNTKVGDGELYKGRGFIQLTGRDNYTRAGQALNLPLADNPALAARPDVAAVIAVWYWKNRVASKVKNFHNTRQVTKAINPAGKGLTSRQDQFKQYQVAQR